MVTQVVQYAGLEVYHFEHFERNPCDSTPRLLLEVTCEEIFLKKNMSSFAPRAWFHTSRMSTKVATRDINFGISIKVPQKVDLKIP